MLKDVRQKIAAGFDTTGKKRENYVLWAFPGTGKTYFVEAVATSLSGIRYHEINLAKCGERDFGASLDALDAQSPYLCLVDEIDAKPHEPWPYEMLLPYLDAAVAQKARFVFVLAGSSGSGIAEMKARIAARPKGADLLSRVPNDNEYVIGQMGVGDRETRPVLHCAQHPPGQCPAVA